VGEGCKIDAVKLKKSYFADKSTVIVDLSCSGEGLTWHSHDTWHVQSIDGRRTLVMTTLNTQIRDDSRGCKRHYSEEAENIGNVDIYLQCK
jgi:hypothetical protein